MAANEDENWNEKVTRLRQIVIKVGLKAVNQGFMKLRSHVLPPENHSVMYTNCGRTQAASDPNIFNSPLLM
jgi:hypothetical protein